MSSPLQLCAILDCGNEKKPSANHCNAATVVLAPAAMKLNRARRAVQPNKTTDWMVCLPNRRVRPTPFSDRAAPGHRSPSLNM